MIRPCQIAGCKNMATDKHHLFSQTKWARKLYGGLLDRAENILWACNGCHLNKVIPKQSEKDFCDKIGIKPRSKTEGAKC